MEKSEKKDTSKDLRERIERGEIKLGKPIGNDGRSKTRTIPQPKGNWIPIEFEDNVPVAYAGWHNGTPAILRIKVSAKSITEDRKKITLRDHDGTKIQDRIKRLKIDGMDMVEFDGEIFKKSEFVNLMVYPQNCNLFTECLNALSLSTPQSTKNRRCTLKTGIFCSRRNSMPNAMILIRES